MTTIGTMASELMKVALNASERAASTPLTEAQRAAADWRHATAFSHKHAVAHPAKMFDPLKGRQVIRGDSRRLHRANAAALEAGQLAPSAQLQTQLLQDRVRKELEAPIGGKLRRMESAGLQAARQSPLKKMLKAFGRKLFHG